MQLPFQTKSCKDTGGTKTIPPAVYRGQRNQSQPSRWVTAVLLKTALP